MIEATYSTEQISEENLHRLLQVTTQLSSTLELQKVLSLVIDVARELTNTEDASILLWDEQRGQLDFVAATGEIPLENVSVPEGSSIAGWIVQQGKPVVINDVQDDPRHYAGVDEAYHFTTRCLIGVPLISRERVIGALEVLNKKDDHPYTVRDLTMLQALASQAAVAIENARLFEQTDLIAEMMHEIKTPLLSLSTAIHLLQREDLPAEQRQLVLQTLQRETDRLTEMSSDFLDLARLETGRFRLERQPVNLAQVIWEVIELETPHAGSNNVTLLAEVDEALPAVPGDQNRLKQVLLNLVNNAIKYNRQGGRVTIRAGQDGESVVLAVSDTGRGIEAQHLKHLFDRFYRVPEDERVASGSGLGLAIAKKIVDAHGGQIEVESVPGEGTTFGCRLPLTLTGREEADKAFFLSLEQRVGQALAGEATPKE